MAFRGFCIWTLQVFFISKYTIIQNSKIRRIFYRESEYGPSNVSLYLCINYKSGPVIYLCCYIIYYSCFLCLNILIPKYKNVGLLVPYCDMNDTADCEG